MPGLPLRVHDWPSVRGDVQPERGLLVVAIRTPATLPRENVRRQVRTALRELLSHQLHCPAEAIELHSTPGQALKLLAPTSNIGLSLSHEPGLSLAALNFNGAVGVDLMAIDSLPPTDEMPALARDYLGPSIARRIAASPAPSRSRTFAEAWTTLEARLKCLGEPLSEWDEVREQRMSECTTHPLQLTEGYIGTLAYRPLNATGT